MLWWGSNTCSASIGESNLALWFTHIYDCMQQEYVTFAFLAQFGLNCNSNIYHSNQDFQIFKEHMPLCMENGSFVYKRLRDLSVYYCDLSLDWDWIASISVILIQKLRWKVITASKLVKSWREMFWTQILKNSSLQCKKEI